MKKLLSILLVLCFILSTVNVSVFAEDIKEIDKPMGSNNKSSEGGLRIMAVPAEPKNSIGKGVDISKYNWKPEKSADIDFSKLAKSVDFVIIRCGYGGNDKSQDDAFFKRSVEACKKYDIPYGVYLYSYATTEAKAKSEAEHTLRMMKDAKADPQLPVFLDMEDERKNIGQVYLSASMKGKIAKKYCNMIEDAGYTTGIYANLNWWQNYLTDSYFKNKIKWVARYNSTLGYSAADMWQCTSSATVSGITGVCDLNYMLKDIYKKNEQINNDAPSQQPLQSLDVSGYSGTYDGKAHSITVKNYKEGTTVEYSLDQETWTTKKPVRTEVGTTKVYYKAIDSDDKEVTGYKNIKITQRDIGTCTFSSISNKYYTGAQRKPNVTVKMGDSILEKDTDYTVTFGKNVELGTGSVTIKGINNFADSKKLTFNIILKKVTNVTTSKGTKAKSAIVKWDKVTGASGYQFAYRFPDGTKWYYTTVTTNKKTFTGMRLKKYKVKVRAYRVVNGVKKYSSYSDLKTMYVK